MADPYLVHRAEQAYLGALLAHQGRAGTGTALAGDAGPGGLAGLRPQDFADPWHQAIYAALAGQALPRRHGLPGLYERLRALASRLLSAQTRDAAAYMAGLPGLCPDSDNLPAYAAMVTEASQARAVPAPVAPAPTAPPPPPAQGPQRPTTENPRLASAGQWLDGTRPGRRQADSRQADPAYTTPQSQTGRAPDGLDRQTARLARALSVDARRLVDRAVPRSMEPVPPQSQPTPLNRNALLNGDALQEHVLADLMLHPASRGDVTSWLPAEVFSAGPNRTLYQLISLRLDSGRPVDPLIIAWDASMLDRAAGSETAQGESFAATALRLGASNPAPGTAAVLAQPLYAEQVCTQAFGPDWRKEPRPVPAPPPVPPAPASTAQVTSPTAAQQAPPAARQPSSPTPTAPAGRVTSRPPWAPAAARHQIPVPPRLASGQPLWPPLPSPAEPGPAPRP